MFDAARFFWRESACLFMLLLLLLAPA